MQRTDILVVMALREESANLFESLDIDLLFTGIGKVNATHQLTKRLLERKAQGKTPKYVINLGSCGSRKFHRGELVACNQFIQRDMDCSNLLGHTPHDVDYFGDRFCDCITTDKIISDLPYGVCGTGDNFATSPCPIQEVDLVEMEGYALAKVCLFEQIKFIAVKYITDGLTSGGDQEWQKSL